MFKLYRFLNDNSEILYIGKTTQTLSNRFSGHYHLPEECYSSTRKIEYANCNSKADLSIYESYYINKFKPIYNTDLKYDDELTIVLPELFWNTYEDSENEKYCKSLKHATNSFKQERDETYIRDTIIDFLYKNKEHVMLQRKDREELINTINVRKNGKQLKSIEILNESLVDMQIPYKLVKFATSRMVNGEKKKYKQAWRIERVVF